MDNDKLTDDEVGCVAGDGLRSGSRVRAMEVKSMAPARRKIKEAQAQANAEQTKRERDNVEDAAVIMVELGKITAVDTWEADQLREVQVEAERGRDERRSEAATALRRVQEHGETLTAISDRAGAPSDALGEVVAGAAAVCSTALTARRLRGEQQRQRWRPCAFSGQMSVRALRVRWCNGLWVDIVAGPDHLSRPVCAIRLLHSTSWPDQAVVTVLATLASLERPARRESASAVMASDRMARRTAVRHRRQLSYRYRSRFRR
ncbi:hypothetical protein GCM10009856_51960 [Mycolicibacterium llatzerense]|jgi:hypothetical protein